MKIDKLELKNYRNYEELHLEFDEHTNLLYGDNAQGKTNILEAIYVCATTKSHRGSKDKEIIRFDQEESHIKLKVTKNDLPYVIDMHLKKNKTKGIAINSVPIKKASELFGTIHVVCFSPEDLDLIKNGPAERRKFINLELCQLNRLYVHSLINYNSILIQKNKLLKEPVLKPEMQDVLDVYDQQLAQYGKEVIQMRAAFIRELNEIIRDIHFQISDQKEQIRIVYEPSEIKNMRVEELRAKQTLSGPHRDDFVFYVNDKELRKYGSQGQQRTAALSLKLSEIELVKKKTGEAPILLLDDVLSELDTGRQNKLLSEIKNIQTVITCTGLEDFVNNNFQITKAMKVEQGTVTVLEA